MLVFLKILVAQYMNDLFRLNHCTACCPSNPFVPNAPFFYPLKTSENRQGFLFSEGRERVHWKQMG